MFQSRQGAGAEAHDGAGVHCAADASCSATSARGQVPCGAQGLAGNAQGGRAMDTRLLSQEFHGQVLLGVS